MTHAAPLTRASAPAAAGASISANTEESEPRSPSPSRSGRAGPRPRNLIEHKRRTAYHPTKRPNGPLPSSHVGFTISPRVPAKRREFAPAYAARPSNAIVPAPCEDTQGGERSSRSRKWSHTHISRRPDGAASKLLGGGLPKWMTFLYAVNQQFSLNDVGSLHNFACHPTSINETLCGNTGLPIAWLDGSIGGTPHGGFLSGAQRKWMPVSAEAQTVERLGREHGVDLNTDPL